MLQRSVRDHRILFLVVRLFQPGVWEFKNVWYIILGAKARLDKNYQEEDASGQRRMIAYSQGKLYFSSSESPFNDIH